MVAQARSGTARISRFSQTAQRARIAALTVLMTVLAGLAGVVMPQQAFAAEGWLQVSAGSDHTCGIRLDNTMWCWGRQGLGTGDGVPRYTPTRVGTAADWTSVSVNRASTCGMRSGTVRWCWGSNTSNALGLGTGGGTYLRPTRPLNDLPFVFVVVGNGRSCGITGGDDYLYCWGSNHEGALGIGPDYSEDVAQPSPMLVSWDQWQSVSANGSSTCGIYMSGERACWGANQNGQLGLGDTDSRNTPTWVDGEGTWKSVAVGNQHTCGILSNSRVYCWGTNWSGELGAGDRVDRADPVRSTSGTMKAVGAGQNFTCSLASGGTRYCWGENGMGQLGIGDTTDRTRPIRLLDGVVWSSLSVGLRHGCAIANDRHLYCWGDNTDGLLGIGSSSGYEVRPVLVD